MHNMHNRLLQYGPACLLQWKRSKACPLLKSDKSSTTR